MPFEKQLINPWIRDMKQQNVSSQTPFTKRFPDCIIIGVMKGGTGALGLDIRRFPTTMEKLLLHTGEKGKQRQKLQVMCYHILK